MSWLELVLQVLLITLACIAIYIFSVLIPFDLQGDYDED